MKKIIIFLLPFFLFGCDQSKDLGNTPIKKVEEYLSKVQVADESIMQNISLHDEYTYDIEEKKRYMDILGKHFGNMTYEIKDETIDGDKAVVEVEINVMDVSKVLDQVERDKKEKAEKFRDDEGNFDYTIFKKYQLDALEYGKERVTYTLTFDVKKKNKEWILEPLSSEEKDKLIGFYKEKNE